MEHAEKQASKYRAWRKALGLTQAELAKLLGVGRDTIVAREAGRSRLIAEHWLALKALEPESVRTLIGGVRA